MQDESEATCNNDDDLPWVDLLCRVAWGAEDFWVDLEPWYGEPIWEPPPLPELAVLMIRCGSEMLGWTYPPEPLAKIVNAIHDQLPELERLIQGYWDAPPEEESNGERDGD